MVKHGGSETAENDGSKLVNVAHPRCQRLLPGRGCYPACSASLGPKCFGPSDLYICFSKETKKCLRLCPVSDENPLVKVPENPDLI
jgi:hypothetical protein